MTSPGGHRASLAEPEGRRRSPAGRCSDPLGGVTTAGPFSTYPTTLPSPAGPFSRKENERYLLKQDVHGTATISFCRYSLISSGHCML